MRFPCIAFSICVLLAGCASPTPDEAAPEAQVSPAEPVASYSGRIAAAESRLGSTPGGELVLRAINAHGGLDNWYAQSPLYYRFNYRPMDKDAQVRDSYILNDYVHARAVHQVANDRDVTYGFDGEDAWQNPADAELSISPRFWSLTPYYFVGLPFVLADEGINFELLDDRELDGQTYRTVKVTYAAGIGDADADYYILYIHPETGQLDALNYIVSYPGFFEDGKHLPEKLMRITGKTTVGGVTLPEGYLTSWSDAPEESITTIEVSEYEFRPGTDPDAFDRPSGAKVMNDLPGK